MMNIYIQCPTLENERYLFRQVQTEDCADLLKVYSDRKAVPLFNSDNCHGDDFHYRTMERMRQAIEFWHFSYQNGYFVRWSMIDKQSTEAIGTVELFRREAEDAFTNTALLRLDLRSDYEQEEALNDILSTILQPACEWYDCCSVTTKAIPEASVRRAVMTALGFEESAEKLKGHDGTLYGDYFVWHKSA